MTRLSAQANLLAIVLLSAVTLLGGGVAYRWLDEFLAGRDALPADLERPLSSLPLQIGSWRGVDVPVSQRVLDIARNDDYVNRRYVNENSRQVVDFYLGYTVQPDNMLGHRPHICYPAHGWTQTATKSARVPLANGRELNCLIHEFARYQPVYQGIVVLNYYILQGRHTCDWNELWGRKRRMPRRSRDADLYVAQVQVSGTFTDPSSSGPAKDVIKRFAARVAANVDSLLPGTERSNERSAFSHNSGTLPVLTTRSSHAGREPAARSVCQTGLNVR